MIFNKHSELEGTHAFLSPSNYHWINYSDEKLLEAYANKRATIMGVQYHEYAAMAIRLKQKQSRSKKTLNMYINDAIGYNMTPEQTLFYSAEAYGTADAIGFERNMLRIHDLKTGVTKAYMQQLEVYDALFCLEYDIRPGEIQRELRIYQNDEVVYHTPEVDVIARIMDKIVHFDRLISERP